MTTQLLNLQARPSLDDLAMRKRDREPMATRNQGTSQVTEPGRGS